MFSNTPIIFVKGDFYKLQIEDFQLNDGMPYRKNFEFSVFFHNKLIFGSQVICTLTKHLNLLGLYIKYDIATSHNKII